MTPEKMRIAIAEACGWTYVVKEHGRIVGLPPGSRRIEQSRPLPDFLSDLNACQEFRNLLDKRQQDVFAGFLASIVCCGHTDYGAMKVMATTEILFATAAQRCEAFLRTMNLWEEEKP